VSILLNGTALAYIGDAIYELEIRKYLVTKKLTKVNDLHSAAIRFTSAIGQAYVAEKLITEMLTETEMEYYRRGRNATSSRKARHADLKTYHQSTGFEALLGYLFFDGQIVRLAEIIDFCIRKIEELESN
jgi:ribonuclease-3 family protein